jgi:hypothetical protein
MRPACSENPPELGDSLLPGQITRRYLSGKRSFAEHVNGTQTAAFTHVDSERLFCSRPKPLT